MTWATKKSKPNSTRNIEKPDSVWLKTHPISNRPEPNPWPDNFFCQTYPIQPTRIRTRHKTDPTSTMSLCVTLTSMEMQCICKLCPRVHDTAFRGKLEDARWNSRTKHPSEHIPDVARATCTISSSLVGPKPGPEVAVFWPHGGGSSEYFKIFRAWNLGSGVKLLYF
jgi:hypothetical protein